MYKIISIITILAFFCQPIIVQAQSKFEHNDSLLNNQAKMFPKMDDSDFAKNSIFLNQDLLKDTAVGYFGLS